MDSTLSTSAPITLVTREGEKFNVTEDVISGSKLMKSFIDDSDTDTPELQLPYISASILPFVLEYMGHYSWTKAKPPTVDPEKPLKNFQMSDYFPRWECSFADKSPQDLYELILAADYFDIPGLKDLMATKIASLVNGKSDEEVKSVIRAEAEAEEKARRTMESQSMQDMLNRAKGDIEEEF